MVKRVLVDAGFFIGVKVVGGVLKEVFAVHGIVGNAPVANPTFSSSKPPCVKRCGMIFHISISA